MGAITDAVETRNAKSDAVARKCDGGLVRIYQLGGARPATADGALPGGTIILAEIRAANPSCPASVNGTITFNAFTQDSSANNAGNADYFRFFKSDDASPTWDGDVTDQAGTGVLKLQQTGTAISAGEPVNVASLTYTSP